MLRLAIVNGVNRGGVKERALLPAPCVCWLSGDEQASFDGKNNNVSSIFAEHLIFSPQL